MGEGLASPVRNEEGRPWRTLINSRRFAWFHFACAAMAGWIWYLSDGRAGPWPLVLAGLPWLARLFSGQFPLPRTRFDPLVFGFLVSALVGAWAGYDQTLAWEKFWLVVGGIVLYYALSGQRSANIWPILTGFALFGGLLGLYFMLTNDWIAVPAKVESLNRIGLGLMEARPAALNNLHRLHPNVAGGILAMLFPFALAVAVRGITKARAHIIILAVLSLGMMFIGLAFTTSRGAWIALVGGLLAWLMWLAAGRVAGSISLTRRKTLGLGLLLALGTFLSVTLTSPGGLIGTLERLPGPSSVGNRLSIVQDAIDLAGDFPLIGSGLASFEGIYSQYIQDIPYYILYHSHDLFLDVTIEQGVVGILMLLAIILASFWWLSDPHLSAYRHSAQGFSLLCGATFATWVVLCLHGLVDDPLYGSRGALLLWLPAGLTAFLFPRRMGWLEYARKITMPALVAVAVLAILTAFILVSYRRPILSAWQSNLGALEMNRVELAGFPSGRWSDGHESTSLDSARRYFERALLYNRDNRTAWHRLGLIAMLERDYDTASDALYNAYLLDTDHRGIRKNLAYAYIWAGHPEQALMLFPDAAEAYTELEVYRGWWLEQGQPIFSARAEDALRLLNERPAP